MRVAATLTAPMMQVFSSDTSPPLPRAEKNRGLKKMTAVRRGALRGRAHSGKSGDARTLEVGQSADALQHWLHCPLLCSVRPVLRGQTGGMIMQSRAVMVKQDCSRNSSAAMQEPSGEHRQRLSWSSPEP